MFPTIKPGFLEVYCGPMKSGKKREIINRVDKVQFLDGHEYIFFKPEVDTRHDHIQSRFGELSISCHKIPGDSPGDMLRLARGKSLVVIDEAQFFDKRVVGIVDVLLEDGVNVVVSGLDLDFKGDPFGPMPLFLSKADKVVKLSAVCDVKGCSRRGSRTQRLVNGEPASRDDSLVRIDGEGEETYEVRCLHHHDVK